MDELKPAKQIAFISWPSPQDYNEAVQNPQHSFADINLCGSFAETDSFGLPRPNTGMFASVYKMRAEESDWALRCFLHFIPDQAERYAAIGQTLGRLQLKSMLPFDFQERGVLVKGQWFPVLKMQWCEGETLDRFLGARLHDRNALNAFLEQWKEVLASFAASGIAHGDLQHGNIMISSGRVRVVDYDGMYVPDLAGRLSNELGHSAYQHPGRRQEHYGPWLDNFSAWVIYLSVEILSVDPEIWKQLRGGEDCLLFRRKDFEKPLSSRAFHLLENHEQGRIVRAARALRYLLSLDPEEVPPLSQQLLVPDLPPVPASLETYGTNQKSFASGRDSTTTQIQPAHGSESADQSGSESEISEELNSSFQTSGVHLGRKRRRSRLKGGASFPTRRAGVLPPENPDPQEPVVLSPLAQLVRKMSSNSSGAVAGLNAAGNQANPTSSSSQQNQFPSSLPLSGSTGLAYAPGGVSGQPGTLSSVFRFTNPFVVAALTLMLILLCLVFVSNLSWHQPQIPVLAKANSFLDQQQFEKSLEEYDSVIRAAVQQRSTTEASNTQAASASAGSERAKSLQIEAWARENSGLAYMGVHKYQEALDQFLQASELFKEIKNGESVELARSIGLQGKAFEALGRNDDAASAYSQAVSMYEHLGIHPFLNNDMAEFMAAHSRCTLAGH